MLLELWRREKLSPLVKQNFETVFIAKFVFLNDLYLKSSLKAITKHSKVSYGISFSSLAILQDSSIIKNKKWIEKLEGWLPSNLHGKLTERCYKASVNGWSSSTFHSRCDSKGPTLVIIKSGSYVFGGFASQSWGGGKLEKIR